MDSHSTAPSKIKGAQPYCVPQRYRGKGNHNLLLKFSGVLFIFVESFHGDVLWVDVTLLELQLILEEGLSLIHI